MGCKYGFRDPESGACSLGHPGCACMDDLLNGEGRMSWIDDIERDDTFERAAVTDVSLAKLIAAARWAEAELACIDYVPQGCEGGRGGEALMDACEAAEAAYRAVRDK